MLILKKPIIFITPLWWSTVKLNAHNFLTMLCVFSFKCFIFTLFWNCFYYLKSFQMVYCFQWLAKLLWIYITASRFQNVLPVRKSHQKHELVNVEISEAYSWDSFRKCFWNLTFCSWLEWFPCSSKIFFGCNNTI